jgi:hypothetical protein
MLYCFQLYLILHAKYNELHELVNHTRFAGLARWIRDAAMALMTDYDGGFARLRLDGADH